MAAHQVAEGLASLGRGKDTMLMHVTPNEVAGLQNLAMAQGGSLTINPDTGLPEAGFFDAVGDVLGAVAPIAVGALLGPAGFGLSALQAGIATGALGFAISGGDLGAGLSAGLGGYGGSGLGQSLSKMGATKTIDPIKAVGFGAEGSAAASPAATAGFEKSMGLDKLYNAGSKSIANAIPSPAVTAGFEKSMGLDKIYGVTEPANTFTANVSRMGEGAMNAIKNPVGFFGKEGPGSLMDGLTLASPLMAIKPKPYKLPKDNSYQMNYEGPYTPQDREPRMPTLEEQEALRAQGSPEYSYFGNTNPYPGFNKVPGYAVGGMAHIYEPQEDVAPPTLSQNGFGLGRLNQLANNGESGFAGGGAIAFDAGGTVPYMGGAPSYGIAPTDLSKVAAIPNAGGTDSSSDSGLKGILSNMITDPLGRTSGGMNGKGMGDGSPTGNMTYPNGGAGWGASFLKALNKPEASAPKALTMQDYINSAARVYNPAASMATATNPGAVEQAQFTNINPQQPVLKAMGGGIHTLKSGGRPTQGGYLDGAGDGMSDSIPATIGDKQPARLADGEFVMPADVVSHLGNGSTKAGAKHLYKVMDKVRRARTGNKKQGKQINPNRFMSA
jgi:hypothetical protein